MSQLKAGILGFLGLFWLAVAGVMGIVVRAVWIQEGVSPEEMIFVNGATTAVVLPSLLGAAGFFAAASGIVRNERWARGLAFLLTPLAVLSFIGIPWAIAQFFVLNRE